MASGVMGDEDDIVVDKSDGVGTGEGVVVVVAADTLSSVLFASVPLLYAMKTISLIGGSFKFPSSCAVGSFKPTASGFRGALGVPPLDVG